MENYVEEVLSSKEKIKDSVNKCLSITNSFDFSSTLDLEELQHILLKIFTIADDI